MFIRLLPSSNVRTQEGACAIAEECLDYMRAAFPDGPWNFTIVVGEEFLPSVSRTFRSTQNDKAMRWLVRELEQPGTAVTVSLARHVCVGRLA